MDIKANIAGTYLIQQRLLQCQIKIDGFLTGFFVSGWLAVGGGTSKERGLNSVHIDFTTQVPIVYGQLVSIL